MIKYIGKGEQSFHLREYIPLHLAYVAWLEVYDDSICCLRKVAEAYLIRNTSESDSLP